MANISITTDTFKPAESTTVLQNVELTTLEEFVHGREENFETAPWLCVLVRDEKRFYPLRNEWKTTRIEKDDTIHFLPHVGDPVSIVLAIIVIVAVVFVLMSMPTMADPMTTPDPVSSIDGRRNKARLNSPIEDAYGRNKLWVSYISQPYTRFTGNNKQILHQHLTLGHGEFDIEDVLLEDTPADNFPEVEYWVDDISQFDNNVSVAQEVQNLELLGTNYDDYEGYIGPFAVNPPNTTIEHVEIDYVLPNGGYYMDDDDGEMNSVDIHVVWEAREIDREGRPVDANDWEKVYTFRQSLRTNQTIRKTVDRKLSRAARWEVRCKRKDESFKDTTGTDGITWAGLRGYRGNMAQPTGLTTLSLKTKATTNSVSNKINVLATRKIPVWDGVAWSAPVASRNPIWIMVNILKSDWGGQMPDDQLDLVELKETADLADAAGETFDWVFDTKTTVWEAVKLCCQVCRSSPLLRGSRVSAIRDVASSVPVMLFNSNNIHHDSLKIQRQVYNLDGKDGLEATYLDHLTWKDETVTALLPGQAGINTKSTTLRGITNRAQAVKTANYIWGSEFYNREVVTFKTTHAGFSATYQDLIKVESDVPDWGQGGEVDAITGGDTITLTEKPSFVFGQDHNISLRTKTGGFYGPFLCEPVTGEGNEYKVFLTGGTLDETNIPIADGHEKPAYIFGPVSNDGKLCRIVKVANAGQDDIEITAVVENYGRFNNDNVPPPVITYPPLTARNSVNGVVSGTIVDVFMQNGIQPRVEVAVVMEPGDTTNIDWYYSNDGFNWTFYGYGSSNPMQVLLPDDNQTWFIKAVNKEVIDAVWVESNQDLVITYTQAGWIELIDDSGDDNVLTTENELYAIPLRTDEINP